MNISLIYLNNFLLLTFLTGCQQYEINYIGHNSIVAREVKLPDTEVGYGSGNQLMGNNTAFEFTLMNMDVDDLNYDEFLSIQAFICGQNKFETNLHSAVYFSEELEFSVGQIASKTDSSVYAVFYRDLLADMKKDAKKQGKVMCAKMIYRYPYELKKVSNTVTLEHLE